MKAGPFPSIPNLRRFAGEKCIPLSSLMCFSLVWVVLVAASTPQKIAPKTSPSSAPTSGRSGRNSGGGTGSIQNHIVCQTSNITSILRVPNTIDADDIIDELISGFCEDRDSGGGGEEVEGVYQSTQVYPSPIVQMPTPHTRSRRQKVKKSHLKREGASLLKAVTTLASRTTHGVCRAVNVTGTAASVVTGGVFKLAGAAVLDAVDGLEYASSKSPTEVPGITEAYRFLAKGLRTTGEVMYDFGVAAENMTAEATEAAEETIRSVLDSVIETASGAYVGEGSSSNGSPSGYFAKEEDRIIDDMMFGTSYPGVGKTGRGEDAGDDAMGYVEGGHSMDNEWATGGQRGSTEPKRDRKEQKGNGMVETKATALAARVREAIRRSILRSSRAVPSMRFPQMLACGLVFTVRGLTSNPWCGAASFVGARVYLKFVESIYLECLKERMMSDIKFEAVARLHEGSPERARWFNTAVSAMWVPMLEPLLARWTSRQIARGIERSLPSNVSWVGLGKVTLGPRPPTIRYVQVQNVTSLAARKSMGQESNSVIDSVLLEAGRPGGNVKAEHVVYLELGVDWTSYRSKVSLRLGEQSRRRRNWWSVTSYVPSYRVKLCDLGIKAKVIVAMAVGEGRPFVKRLWVGFAEPPLTHLSLEALTGMDIANLPVLRNHLRHVVMRCLTPLTEPRHLVIQMKPPANPPSAYRGAALAARVRPAAAGVRRGVFSRVPAFGLRRLLRNRSRTAATSAAASPSAPAATLSTTMDALAEGGEEEDLPRKGDLKEATRMLLVDVGGECRGETVMAAAAAMRGGEPWPLISLDRNSRQLAEGSKDQSGDQRYTAEQEDRRMMEGNGGKSEQLYPRVEAPVAEKSYCDAVGSITEGGEEFAAAGTPEERAASISSEEILACDKAVVAVVESEAYKHSRDRRGEETQRRRAVVKRRRAALREDRDALSPGRRGGAFAFASLGRCRSCLRLTHLRHPWRSRRQKQQPTLFGKVDPDLEDIIRRICLLSTPPQREI